MIDAEAMVVRQRLGVGELAVADGLLDKRQACLEALVQGRGIEDDIGEFLPQVAPILPPDNADGALEFFSVNPKFAVKRNGGSPSMNQSGA